MTSPLPSTPAPNAPPLVSIVIPVYNGGDYLREAIESALAQSHRHCEVIVVNDGSTDGGATERIALSYGERIRYFRKENGGVASALNLGIREMSGEYFSWLSHDDRYYPDKVSTQLACLEKFDRPVVLYSDFDIIDGGGEIVRRMHIGPYPPEAFCRALLLDNPIQGCTALVPRECFARLGDFDEKLRTTQDYDMWFRLAQHYEFVHMPCALIQSREHPMQGTITLTTIHVPECNDFLLRGVQKALCGARNCGSGDQKGEFLAECVYSFLERGFYRAAHRTLLLYLRSLSLEEVLRRPQALRPVRRWFASNSARVVRRLQRRRSSRGDGGR